MQAPTKHRFIFISMFLTNISSYKAYLSEETHYFMQQSFSNGTQGSLLKHSLTRTIAIKASSGAQCKTACFIFLREREREREGRPGVRRVRRTWGKMRAGKPVPEYTEKMNYFQFKKFNYKLGMIIEFLIPEPGRLERWFSA